GAGGVALAAHTLDSLVGRVGVGPALIPPVAGQVRAPALQRRPAPWAPLRHASGHRCHLLPPRHCPRSQSQATPPPQTSQTTPPPPGIFLLSPSDSAVAFTLHCKKVQLALDHVCIEVHLVQRHQRPMHVCLTQHTWKSRPDRLVKLDSFPPLVRAVLAHPTPRCIVV